LLVLKAEYATWLASLPDSLHATPTAEALLAIADLDLETLADIDPPRAIDPTAPDCPATHWQACSEPSRRKFGPPRQKEPVKSG
jgi:hypothetical protein